VYVLDNDAGADELFLYGADDVLIDHLVLSDYDWIDEGDEYEALEFYDVRIQSMPQASGLTAYGEYDYYNEFIFWSIYDDSEELIMEIDFW
jgi:hypothetical protein